MNCTKTKPSLQDQQLSCYRIWTRPKAPKKADKRNHVSLGQYLFGTKK